MSATLTIWRYGQKEELTFESNRDAQMMLAWFTAHGATSGEELQFHNHRPHNTGALNPYSKLDEIKVRQIRRAAAAGFSRRALARDYKVSQSCIDRVVTRQTWGHVE